jgi:hypothetical protein
MHLEPGDVLVLVGSHAEIVAAFLMLEGREDTPPEVDAETPETE